MDNFGSATAVDTAVQTEPPILRPFETLSSQTVPNIFSFLPTHNLGTTCKSLHNISVAFFQPIDTTTEELLAENPKAMASFNLFAYPENWPLHLKMQHLKRILFNYTTKGSLYSIFPLPIISKLAKLMHPPKDSIIGAGEMISDAITLDRDADLSTMEANLDGWLSHDSPQEHAKQALEIELKEEREAHQTNMLQNFDGWILHYPELCKTVTALYFGKVQPSSCFRFFKNLTNINASETELFKWSDIYHLYFPFAQSVTISGTTAHHDFRSACNLKSLKLFVPQVHSSQTYAQSMQHVKLPLYLEKLTLRGYEFTDPTYHYENMKQLKTLSLAPHDIPGTKGYDVKIPPTIALIPNLESLSLRSFQYVQTLENLGLFKEVTHLYLETLTRLKTVNLAQFPKLKSLTIIQCFSIENLESLQQNKKIESISISHCSTTSCFYKKPV